MLVASIAESGTKDFSRTSWEARSDVSRRQTLKLRCRAPYSWLSWPEWADHGADLAGFVNPGVTSRLYVVCDVVLTGKLGVAIAQTSFDTW